MRKSAGPARMLGKLVARFVPSLTRFVASVGTVASSCTSVVPIWIISGEGSVTLIWSATYRASASVPCMSSRPAGSAGLPDRTSDTARSNTPRGAVVAVGVIATALAVLYPSFGVTLIVVLIAEPIAESRRGSRQGTTRSASR